MDGEQPNFIASNHIEDAVFVETFQPDTADIFKANGIKQGVSSKGGDDGVGFIKKIVAESRLLTVIPVGSGELVFLNEPGLFYREAHGGGRAPVRSFLPTALTVLGGRPLHRGGEGFRL